MLDAGDHSNSDSAESTITRGTSGPLKPRIRENKAEQKEKEKRQRERLRSLEIQRDKLHKAAW
ncbi:hypothetical protein ANCDUO_16395 [Ancylostoma duodenale]|uniref:Uncharacterized protein n=1 Tax=Ancylostoma duodenale TaxID=51022 RepID=A0A0C2G916_9BILA|nr:hypothetical protein ANCDUO_16395 [Ancylostoma duodenale]